jgi:hypothetical protein
MLDIFNIPGQQDNVKIFYAGGGTNDWQTWTKPRNCKFIWMMCIGAGAGGQTTGTTSTGIGGGSGAITKAIFPANTLPDILFVQPGIGAINTIGGRSWVVINPSGSVPVAMNTVCVSGTAGAGTTSLANGETAATTTVAGLLSLGTFQSTAGTANPQTATFTPSSSLTNPGGNGGTPGVSVGTSTLSVTLTPNIITPTILGGSVIGAGDVGGNGIFYWKPLFSLGGSGGNSSSTEVGGNGGNGAYGSGGGGCGGSTSGTSVGGKGGDGLVVIATF